MSDANRMTLAYIEESTFGVIEPANPTMQDLRFTSESLRQDTNSTESAEIRADRQIADVIRTGISGAGDISIEYSYSAFDDFFEAGLLSAVWTTESQDIAGANTVSVDGANVYTIDAGTWTVTPAVGSWVEIRVFVAAVNNGYKRVTASTTTTMTVTGAATSVEATVAGASITTLAHVTNGTTLRTFNIEKEYADVASLFALLTGMAIDGVNLDISSDQLVTGGFSFVGSRSLSSRTATMGDGTNTAAASNEVMNAIDNVPTVLEALVTYDVTGFTMALTNNLRARVQVGTLGAISLGTGTVGITGTTLAYFDALTIMDKYLDATTSDLVVVLEDDAGNGYVFDLPQVKYTSGQRVAGGLNQDIIAEMAYTAFRDPTLDYTLRIARFTSTSA